ncbi:hypothetical protein HW132_32635 [Brasilonema sp. CT11]|nr:hypothetical protein [Brasilonema sp. CT11]
MRTQIVLQHSEEDCGAACIATIAKHYKRTFAISRVREAVQQHNHWYSFQFH